mmetsp:Transcript_86379/g.277283  ORF Transcript_86379/g.277283 Transcript_86379/m.277283 type:complete len:292 (+) Transcript_86379:1052-1927(+)
MHTLHALSADAAQSLCAAKPRSQSLQALAGLRGQLRQQEHDCEERQRRVPLCHDDVAEQEQGLTVGTAEQRVTQQTCRIAILSAAGDRERECGRKLPAKCGTRGSLGISNHGRRGGLDGTGCRRAMVPEQLCEHLKDRHLLGDWHEIIFQGKPRHKLGRECSCEPGVSDGGIGVQRTCRGANLGVGWCTKQNRLVIVRVAIVGRHVEHLALDLRGATEQQPSERRRQQHRGVVGAASQVLLQGLGPHFVPCRDIQRVHRQCRRQGCGASHRRRRRRRRRCRPRTRCSSRRR